MKLKELLIQLQTIMFYGPWIILPVLLANGCGEAAAPKPRGHFRIDFPDKEYVRFDSICPFVFDYPLYGKIEQSATEDPSCWFNISYDDYSGKLHLSYYQVTDNLEALIEDAHKLAYKHTVKADAIEETWWINDQKQVYGLIYNIKGNAASSVQFYLTDSVQHYLRGALYFNTQPDKDSLAPVIDFFREDVKRMVETFEWRYKNEIIHN